LIFWHIGIERQYNAKNPCTFENQDFFMRNLSSRFLSFSVALMASLSAVAQQETINKAVVARSISTHIPSDKLFVVERRNLQSPALPTVRLQNAKYQTINNPEWDASMQWPESDTPVVKLTVERKQPIALIFVPQYRKQADGRIEALVSYDIDVQENKSSVNKTAGNRVYAAHSVLASGSFYQIGVSTTGVYKVDYSFIKNTLGVDPAGINPSNIRLYGNGGEMLSENNAVIPKDDLYENAIEVVDGGDGHFDAGDYFLFYANGPHSVYLADTINRRFAHTFNIYSETSYYYIQFSAAPGKRISSVAVISPATTSVNSFPDFAFLEKDSSNPGKFGKTWWGDEFSDLPGRYLQRNYSFLFPNLIPDSSVTVRTRFGAISSSGMSTIAVNANGSLLFTNGINPVGGTFADPVTRFIDQTVSTHITSPSLNLQLSFTKGSSTASGFLDFIEVNARRQLTFAGYLNFMVPEIVGPGQVADYQISEASSTAKVWEITQPLDPMSMLVTLSGSQLNFRREADTYRRFVMFDARGIAFPAYVQKISNQDLHAYSPCDNIIIAPPALQNEAARLAAHHLAKRNVRTLVVSPEQIYHEFSSGTPDVSAIRNFLKMYYDRASMNDIPKYVLLMGDASYDYKNRIKGNTNDVPTYETYESNDKITGYCTDDFFGFLDDNEDINNFGTSQINTLDVGVGRIPVSTASAAANVVNKIIHYDSPASFGAWKNNMTFNTDDGDGAIHLQDGEIMSQYATDSLSNFNPYKIYVDGFVEQSTPAGPRTPAANEAITAQIYNGTFLMNYNGHGGPLGWCEERIFSMDDVNLMKNINKLPLFITATCDFAPYDDPSVNSAGEILINKADGGAIGLMTTTRLVYQDQNREMNYNYMRAGFRPMANGMYPTLGDAWRLSKNLRYVSYVGQYAAANFRKFALLGDPALPLAFPKYRVMTDSINGVSVNVSYDTLQALGKYTISGHVADASGMILSNFNGYVYPTIFDKPKKLTTLQNGTDNPKQEYYVQNNAIYKGKATVSQGKFQFTFVVPKDINYDIAKGKISYYADNGNDDASGNDKNIFVGGSNTNAGTDNVGPVIKAFLNDEKFVNGGITPPNATLLLKLSDDNGINYTGNSIGHDITAVLDGNAQNLYVLNNFFEATVDDYRSGTVKFPLNNLTEGKHTLQIKAWDISNNSAEAVLNFVVTQSNSGQLAHIYNYPNPFTTHTQFMFEHNMPNQNLDVSIRIYSVSGKMVKSIHTFINTEGTRSDSIEWDGRDEYGDKLAKGVYLYKLSVKSATGKSDSGYQKLILLN
jgi:hypothetical protein